MGDILIGTASWADPTLVNSGLFYPPWARTPEARLQFYASRFPIVEVDSSYYAIPAEKVARLWVERTPDRFIFNVKAFRLLTQHPTPIPSLPKNIRDALPAGKASVYSRDVPPALIDEVWKLFEDALLPLDSTGKLGVVLFQFPPWFLPGDGQRDYILSCKRRLPQYRIAVEFRHGSWLNEENRERTLRFLRDNDLPFVCVDEPQGFQSSVPPVLEATSDIALLRLHGRNRETWEKKGISAAERFDYLYSEDELKELVPGLRQLAALTGQLHVLFNNHCRDKAVVNARQMRDLMD